MPSRRSLFPSPSSDVRIEINGKEYRGSYRVEGRPPLVYLTSNYGNKATHLGSSPAETIARVLLHELVAHLH